MQFGRCPWFALYDSSSRQVTYLQNTGQNTSAEVGISVAYILIAAGVSRIIAGRFGLKAADYLRGKNVQMIVPHVEDMTLDRILEKINRQA